LLFCRQRAGERYAEGAFFAVLAVTYAFFLLPLTSIFERIIRNQVLNIVVAL
jgi:hypothetical protein